MRLEEIIKNIEQEKRSLHECALEEPLRSAYVEARMKIINEKLAMVQMLNDNERVNKLRLKYNDFDLKAAWDAGCTAMAKKKNNDYNFRQFKALYDTKLSQE